MTGTRRVVVWLTVGLTLVLTGACGDDGTAVDTRSEPNPASTATTAAPGTTAAPAVTTTNGAGGATAVTSTAPATSPAAASSDRRVTAARDDLVKRFGYDPAAVSVVSIEQVTWPNAALGCPETDRQYAQVTIDGYRIVLAWKDVQFRYHGKSGELPFLCQFLE